MRLIPSPQMPRRVASFVQSKASSYPRLTVESVVLSKIKTIGVRLSKARSLFVVLGWGLSLTSLTLAAITSAVLVPHAGVESYQLLGVVLYYAGVFAISLLSGLLLRSLTVAVPGTFVAYVLGLVLTGLVL